MDIDLHFLYLIAATVVGAITFFDYAFAALVAFNVVRYNQADAERLGQSRRTWGVWILCLLNAFVIVSVLFQMSEVLQGKLDLDITLTIENLSIDIHSFVLGLFLVYFTANIALFRMMNAAWKLFGLAILVIVAKIAVVGYLATGAINFSIPELSAFEALPFASFVYALYLSHEGYMTPARPRTESGVQHG